MKVELQPSSKQDFKVLSQGWDCWQNHNDINPPTLNLLEDWALAIVHYLKSQETPFKHWHNASELSLTWLDLEEMTNLNNNHLGHNYVTDVLSFSLIDSADKQEDGFNLSLGDVVICPRVVVAQAMQCLPFFKTLTPSPHLSSVVEARVCHLLAHAILHLLGYDHQNKTQTQKMQAQEKILLERLGFESYFFETFLNHL